MSGEQSSAPAGFEMFAGLRFFRRSFSSWNLVLGESGRVGCSSVCSGFTESRENHTQLSDNAVVGLMFCFSIGEFSMLMCFD